MANINSVTISGNIVRAEPIIAPSNKVLSQTIATSAWSTDKEVSSFIDFKVLGEKRVAALQNMLVKGAKVIINGRLQQETWVKDGETKSKLVVLADNVEITKFADDGNKTTDLTIQPKAQNTSNITEATVDMSDIPF